MSPKPTSGPASDPDPTKRPGEVSEQSRFFTGTVLESHDPASKENTPENVSKSVKETHLLIHTNVIFSQIL